MFEKNYVSKDKLIASFDSRDELKIEPIFSTYVNDPDFTDLLEDFAKGLSERVHKMQVALQHNDIGQVEDLAHKLNGVAGFVGYPALSKAAKALEYIAAQGSDVEAVKLALNKLHSMCKSVLAGIKRQ